MTFADIYKGEVCYRFSVANKGDSIVSIQKAVDEIWGESREVCRDEAISLYKQLIAEGYIRPVPECPRQQPVHLGQHWR